MRLRSGSIGSRLTLRTELNGVWTLVWDCPTHNELREMTDHNRLCSVYMVEYTSCPNRLTTCVVKDVGTSVGDIQRGLLAIA